MVKRIWHEVCPCLDKGFAVLTHESILDMERRKNVSEKITMNVYDYAGNKLYNEKIETNENLINSGKKIWFKAKVDDIFIARKIDEFQANKGGDGK